MKDNKQNQERTPAQVFFDKRKLEQVAKDVRILQSAGKIFLTAGGETLVEQYGFTHEEAAEWAKLTIEKAESYLVPE